MRRGDIAKQAAVELHQHASESLFFALLLALFLHASWHGASGWISLPALAAAGLLYLTTDAMGLWHQSGTANLCVEQQKTRIAAIKRSHRRDTGTMQQVLAPGSRPRGFGWIKLPLAW
jgi:hypothetical protein